MRTSDDGSIDDDDFGEDEVDVAAVLRVTGREDKDVVARMAPELARRCGAEVVDV